MMSNYAYVASTQSTLGATLDRSVGVKSNDRILDDIFNRLTKLHEMLASAENQLSDINGRFFGHDACDESPASACPTLPSGSMGQLDEEVGSLTHRAARLLNEIARLDRI